MEKIEGKVRAYRFDSHEEKNQLVAKYGDNYFCFVPSYNVEWAYHGFLYAKEDNPYDSNLGGWNAKTFEKIKEFENVVPFTFKEAMDFGCVYTLSELEERVKNAKNELQKAEHALTIAKATKKPQLGEKYRETKWKSVWMVVGNVTEDEFNLVKIENGNGEEQYPIGSLWYGLNFSRQVLKREISNEFERIED